MVSSCYVCRGDVAAVTMTVDFHWGEKIYLIDDVPTHVCRRCGQKYFESAVYHRMEQLSEMYSGPHKCVDGPSIQFGKIPVNMQA